MRQVQFIQYQGIDDYYRFQKERTLSAKYNNQSGTKETLKTCSVSKIGRLLQKRTFAFL